MKSRLFLILSFLVFSPVVFASDLTHLLGNSGYMIREAMQAHAGKKAPVDFKEALSLQKQAKLAFRGYYKKGKWVGRNRDQAIELAQQAYVAAKRARDLALGK